MNQRMVGRLLERKKKVADQPAWQSRSYIALGIEVSQSREERTGKSMQEAAREGGLDTAFFAIVEAGKATGDELTGDVLEALARSVDARVRDLASAMSVQESYHSRDTAGQMVHAVLSLCQPSFLTTAVTYKSIHSGRRPPPARSSTIRADMEPMRMDSGEMLPDLAPPPRGRGSSSDLHHDEGAGISYRIGGLSRGHPPTLSFYELGKPEAPLRGWEVSVMNGFEELATGVTDERGVYEFPEGMSDFPDNAHMVIKKSR